MYVGITLVTRPGGDGETLCRLFTLCLLGSLYVGILSIPIAASICWRWDGGGGSVPTLSCSSVSDQICYACRYVHMYIRISLCRGMFIVICSIGYKCGCKYVDIIICEM